MKVKKFIKKHLLRIFAIVFFGIALALIISFLLRSYENKKQQESLKNEFFKGMLEVNEKVDSVNCTEKSRMKEIEKIPSYVAITDSEQKVTLQNQDVVVEDSMENVDLVEENVEELESSNVQEEIVDTIVEATEEPVVIYSETGLPIMAYIEIPKINIEYVIVEGVDKVAISKSIGHFPQTALPGEEGNFCLAGHRGGKNGVFFKNLDELEIGDKIIVTDLNAKQYVYNMTEAFTVEATDLWVLDAKDGKVITLVTCNDNGKRRLIVRGEIAE